MVVEVTDGNFFAKIILSNCRKDPKLLNGTI
jgi:hypothetical protein